MQFFEDGYLPTINTTFSFFGGHAETVEPGWRWPTEHYPAFEIMYIMDGAQRTVTESAEKIIKAGEMMIIPIGMEHTNYCWGNEPMTFFTMHFNLDDPAIKYLLVKNFTNQIIDQTAPYYNELRQSLEQIISIIGTHYSLSDRLTIELNTINVIGTLIRHLHANKDQLPKQNEIDHYALFQQISTRIKDELNEQIFNAQVPKTISIASIIAEFHISQSTALHLFKQYSQQSPQKYLQSLKMQIAKNLLLQPDLSIKEVAYKLNYSSPGHFSREFKRFFGITPRQYIQSQKA